MGGFRAIISRAIGEGDTYKVRRITTDGLTLAVVLVFIFVIIGLSTVGPLFKLLGATPQVLPYIKQYMGIWYYGMFFVLIPIVGNNAIRATGDTKTPSAIMIVAVIMNFIMDPMLIFRTGTFPRSWNSRCCDLNCYCSFQCICCSYMGAGSQR